MFDPNHLGSTLEVLDTLAERVFKLDTIRVPRLRLRSKAGPNRFRGQLKRDYVILVTLSLLLCNQFTIKIE